MPVIKPTLLPVLAASLLAVSACATPPPERTASEKLAVNNQPQPSAYISHGDKPVCGYTAEDEECLADVTTKRGYQQYDNADDRGFHEALVHQADERLRDERRERKKRD